MLQFQKKNIEYERYLILLELIKQHGVTLTNYSELTESEFNKEDYVVLVGTQSPNVIYSYMYIYNAYNMDLKQLLISKIPDIKQQVRSFVINNHVIISDQHQKMLTPLKQITSDDPNSYIRHRYVPENFLLCNLLHHESLRAFKYKVLKSEDEKKALLDKLNLSMRGKDDFIITLPLIEYTDPLAIWLDVNPGDILQYGAEYRYCGAKKS